MEIINNKKEYIEKYPYNCEPNKYPSSYPCIMKMEQHEGGLGTSYYEIELMYPTDDLDIETIFKCLNLKWEVDQF